MPLTGLWGQTEPLPVHERRWEPCMDGGGNHGHNSSAAPHACNPHLQSIIPVSALDLLLVQ